MIATAALRFEMIANFPVGFFVIGSELDILKTTLVLYYPEIAVAGIFTF